MFRKALLSIVTLGTLASAAVPAMAQPAIFVQLGGPVYQPGYVQPVFFYDHGHRREFHERRWHR